MPALAQHALPMPTFEISCHVAPGSTPRIISASCLVSCLAAERAAFTPSAVMPALVPSAGRGEGGEGAQAMMRQVALQLLTCLPRHHTEGRHLAQRAQARCTCRRITCACMCDAAAAAESSR